MTEAHDEGLGGKPRLGLESGSLDSRMRSINLGASTYSILESPATDLGIGLRDTLHWLDKVLHLWFRIEGETHSFDALVDGYGLTASLAPP